MTDHIEIAVIYIFIALTWAVLGLASRRDMKVSSIGILSDTKQNRRSKWFARFFFIGAVFWLLVAIGLFIIAFIQGQPQHG